MNDMTEERRGKNVDGDDDDSVPISMRDMELEPVSLVEIEKILAPGRTPPARVPPAPKAKSAEALSTEKADAPARKRLPTIPKREPAKVDDEVASIDLRADSATIDLAALSAASTVKKPAIDEELAQLTSVPPPPMAPIPGEIPGVTALSKPLQRGEPPKPPKPLKKRNADSLPDVPADVLPEPIEVEAKPMAKALSSRPPPLPPAIEDEAKPVSRKRAAAPAAAPAKTEPEAKGSSKTLLIVVGAIALLGGGYWLGQRGDTPPQPQASAAAATNTATAPQTTAQTPVATTAPDATTDATATSEPADTAASAAPTASTTSTAKTFASTTSTTTTTTTTSTAAASATTTVVSASAKPTSTPTAEPTGEATAPFDKGAATAAMNSAAGNASACKQEGDPSGSAHVSVTFAPSGRATNANVGGPPYQGTATGSCIARAFKAARVPAFAGAPVTVTKTVNIR